MDSECFYSAVHWPKGGTVADLIDGVKSLILKYLHFADVYLIFKRYHNYNIKSNTRAVRFKSLTRGHNLFRQSPLPSKDDTLSCTKSKVQLIEKISTAGLVDIGLKEKNRFVITSNDQSNWTKRRKEKISITLGYRSWRSWQYHNTTN